MSKKCVITPDCPRCGSKKTGYYLPINSLSDMPKIISERMELGELVRRSVGLSTSDQPNLFCENCGIEWYGSYKTKTLSDDEIKKMRAEKGIELSEIDNLKNYKRIAKRNKKIQRRQNFKNNVRRFVRFKKEKE